jgi:hypothetical protein
MAGGEGRKVKGKRRPVFAQEASFFVETSQDKTPRQARIKTIRTRIKTD